jgi:hypothetical protein
MFERSGLRLEKSEIELLDNLLERMLKYYSEEGVGMQKVTEYP